jgi:molecular chaperone GrpE
MPKSKYDPDGENQQESPAEGEEKLITNPSHEELTQQLSEAEQKVNQYWERILRMQAESENIARRAERDLANAHKFALDKFAAELLPIVDSLELCATSVPPDMQEAAKSVIEGVDLTLKMFYNALEKFGIKQVNPLSQPFNPEFEQAISAQEDTSVPPNTVLSVLQKGYVLNGRLIRPALVIVSKGK